MSDAYSEFCAAFRVKDSGAMHPEITERLGIQPTSSCLRGQPSGALNKPAPHDMWVLDSPLPPEEPLHRHLDWLEQTLRPHVAYIRQLISSGVSVDIFCGYRSSSDYSSYTLPPCATAFANEIGVPLHMSYVVA
jgi:hypothetical protein